MPAFAIDDNRLTLLTSGRERLETLIALIEGARQSLRLLYYIFADDAAGRRVGEALVAATARGVRVALIVDGFGSEAAAANGFFEGLSAQGIDVCRFSPRFGRRYLLRNHQKMALADGEGAARIVVGGFNVEADYFGDGTDPAGEAWRDLGLLVEGPAAARMTRYFDALQDWIHRPRSRLRHLNRALTGFSEASGALCWLIGGPTRRLSPWARTVRRDMRRGTRIDVIAGYFTPSPTMLRRLDRAGRKGGRVRIVTAAKSDSEATIAAARFTYAGLLRKRVRIYEYQPAKLHTKLYVIDDVVHIGSANFDMRSLFINLEIMLRIEDAAFAQAVRGYVDGEIARSREVTSALYKAQTGWLQRVRQFIAYVLIAVIDPRVSRGLNFGIDEGD